MTKPEKSYAELKAELDAVLDSLQHDDIGVDEALEAYESGMKLVVLLETKLKTAENKVTKIKTKFDV